MSLARVVITAVTWRDAVRARSPATTGSPGSGCRSWCTATSGRARPRSSPGPGGRTPTRGRSSRDLEDQISAPQGAVQEGLGRGRGDDRCAPADRRRLTRCRRSRRSGGSCPPRVRQPQPQKRPRSSGEVLRRAAQRTLAGRHHPLAARRRHRGGDPQHPRRPLPGLHRQRRVAGSPPAPRCAPASPPPSTGGASRPACSPTFKLCGALRSPDCPAGGVRIDGSGTRPSSLLHRSERGATPCLLITLVCGAFCRRPATLLGTWRPRRIARGSLLANVWCGPVSYRQWAVGGS